MPKYTNITLCYQNPIAAESGWSDTAGFTTRTVPMKGGTTLAELANHFGSEIGVRKFNPNFNEPQGEWIKDRAETVNNRFWYQLNPSSEGRMKLD
tara:strand:- start:286 stop:570 length:285 start_codon:yes stop_codon:yes gene_type:complete